MANNYFKFKQFTIYQDEAAMKVGTDGVLLGAWVKCEEALNMLDVGAGTGLIALMMAQRSEGIIDAIELDKSAFNQAYSNIQESDWNNRMHVFHSSLQEYAVCSNKRYQVIVCNPPFFMESVKAPSEKRNMARHTESLPADDLFSCCAKLLVKDGCLSIIVPESSCLPYIEIANKYQLYARRITHVKPTPDKPYKRALIEFSKIMENTLENELVIEENGRHQYSSEFKELTENYYLN